MFVKCNGKRRFVLFIFFRINGEYDIIVWKKNSLFIVCVFYRESVLFVEYVNSVFEYGRNMILFIELV